MKLRLVCPTTINGRRWHVGEIIDVHDPNQITAMLESGTAVPASPVELDYGGKVCLGGELGLSVADLCLLPVATLALA